MVSMMNDAASPGRGRTAAKRPPCGGLHVGPLVEGALERDRPPLRFLAGGPFGGVDEGGARAQVKRDVRRPDQLQQVQHVLGPLRDGVVAGDHRDSEHVDPVGAAGGASPGPPRRR